MKAKALALAKVKKSFTVSTIKKKDVLTLRKEILSTRQETDRIVKNHAEAKSIDRDILTRCMDI